MKVLIKADGNVNQARTTDGRSPLFVASERGNVDTVKVLIEAGCNVNQAGNDGYTPLFVASQKGNVAIVKVLLEAACNVNQATNAGSTPLTMASYNGNVEVVRLLLQQSNIDTNNALGLATTKNHTEMIQLLKDASTKEVVDLYLLMFTDTATRLNIELTNEHRIAVEKATRRAINKWGTQIEFTQIEFVRMKKELGKSKEKLDEMKAIEFLAQAELEYNIKM